MGEVVSLAGERERRRIEGNKPTARPLTAGAPGGMTRVGMTSAGMTAGAGSRTPGPAPARREPLWREVSGAVLREERRRQGRTLADVAGRAGMSVQHLSEVERGRKEASSEMLAAAAGSLGLSLAEFTRRCAGALAPAGSPAGPVLLAA
jgi:hypothetical protein